jgi:hypothetical protein
MNKCEYTHVYIRQGCKMVLRIIYYDEDGNKYINLDGRKQLLKNLRGKYRYST